MPKSNKQPPAKQYWCGNCHQEFLGEPPIIWQKDLYDWYHFCSKKCSDQFKQQMQGQGVIF